MKLNLAQLKDTLANPQAAAAILMASVGFGAKAISAKTGLTEAQIRYRLKLAEIKIKDYRDGNTVLSRKVMQACSDTAREQLAAIERRLREQLALVEGKP